MSELDVISSGPLCESALATTHSMLTELRFVCLLVA